MFVAVGIPAGFEIGAGQLLDMLYGSRQVAALPAAPLSRRYPRLMPTHCAASRRLASPRRCRRWWSWGRRRTPPPSGLSDVERERILRLLNQRGYVDLSVAQVWAREAGKGRWWCSQLLQPRTLPPPWPFDQLGPLLIVDRQRRSRHHWHTPYYRATSPTNHHRPKPLCPTSDSRALIDTSAHGGSRLCVRSVTIVSRQSRDRRHVRMPEGRAS